MSYVPRALLAESCAQFRCRSDSDDVDPSQGWFAFDVLVVVVDILVLAFPGTGLLQAFRGARAIRLVRLVRLLKAGKISQGLAWVCLGGHLWKCSAWGVSGEVSNLSLSLSEKKGDMLAAKKHAATNT